MLGLGQPEIHYYDYETPVFYSSDLDKNFMLQMQVQEPHYESLACFNYYWNSTVGVTQMLIGSESAVNQYCVPGFDKILEVASYQRDYWSLEIIDYVFGSIFMDF